MSRCGIRDAGLMTKVRSERDSGSTTGRFVPAAVLGTSILLVLTRSMLASGEDRASQRSRPGVARSAESAYGDVRFVARAFELQLALELAEAGNRFERGASRRLLEEAPVGSFRSDERGMPEMKHGS